MCFLHSLTQKCTQSNGQKWTAVQSGVHRDLLDALFLFGLTFDIGYKIIHPNHLQISTSYSILRLLFNEKKMKMSWQFGSNFYHSKEVLSQDAILHLQRPLKQETMSNCLELWHLSCNLNISLLFQRFKGPNYGKEENE